MGWIFYAYSDKQGNTLRVDRNQLLCAILQLAFLFIHLMVGFTFNRAKVNNGFPPLKAKRCLLKKSPFSLRSNSIRGYALGQSLAL